jgi:hypothetical protein
MLTCHECQSHIDADSQFCKECGMSLSGAVVQRADGVEAPANAAQKRLHVMWGVAVACAVGITTLALGPRRVTEKATVPVSNEQVVADVPGGNVANAPSFLPRVVNIAQPGAVAELVRSIQAIPVDEMGFEIDDGFDRKLAVLRAFFKEHSIDESGIPLEGLPGSIHAEAVSGFGVIVFKQHVDRGRVIFIDPRTNQIALVDKIDRRIVDHKTLADSPARPHGVLVVRYRSMHGSGTYGETMRVYTVDAGVATLSLEKPYFEYNSGWGAFVDAFAEFKLKQDYVIAEGIREIHTTGVAVMKVQEETVCVNGLLWPDGGWFIRNVRNIPEERYVWDIRSRQFVQMSGRQTHRRALPTSIYSDLADAKGEWFECPPLIKEFLPHDPDAKEGAKPARKPRALPDPADYEEEW